MNIVFSRKREGFVSVNRKIIDYYTDSFRNCKRRDTHYLQTNYLCKPIFAVLA